jgi:hypothetical protein
MIKNSMKKTLNLLIAAATMIEINSAFAAQTYTDAIGETINAASGTIDFVGAEVSNTATDLVISLKVDGNVGTTDWGKFMIGIATTKTDGTTSGNGWGRPINLSAPSGKGMNFWTGAWVDGGGGSELNKYTSGTPTGSWSNIGSSNQQIGTYETGKSLLTYTYSLATLGVTVGDTIYFDAYSSGGGSGDGAIDALANSAQSISAWGGSYTSSGSNLNSYTLVPEPSTGMLMGLGVAGLLVVRRIRKSA